jgi:hypothetical protein
MNERAPVSEVFGAFAGGLVAAGEEGYGGYGVPVAVQPPILGGGQGELAQKVSGYGAAELGEGAADGGLEGAFEAGEDLGFEVRVFEMVPGEGDELAPLLADLEHLGDEALAVDEVGVAMQQDGAQGVVERGVGAAQLEQRAAGCLLVEVGGVGYGALPSAAAGEQG